MIVSAFFLPYCPAVIPEIGKKHQQQIPQTCAMYETMTRVFQEKDIETVLLISSQTIPSINEFIVHTNTTLQANIIAEDNTISFSCKTQTNLLSRVREEVANYRISLSEGDGSLDYGQAVPLYFLEKNLKNFEVIAAHINWDSGDKHKLFGEALGLACLEEKKNIGVILAGDLSNKLDQGTKKEIEITHRWNKKLMDILSSKHFSYLSTLSILDTEEAGGLHVLHGLKVLEGIFSKHLYKAKASSYEEAFGIGLGSVEFEIM